MALVAFILFSSLRETFTFASPGQTVIQTTALDGKSSFDSNVSLPESLNQDQGITFSYSCWVRIDDFTYRPGKPKVIFTKGPTDLSSSCPSLLIDGN